MDFREMLQIKLDLLDARYNCKCEELEHMKQIARKHKHSVVRATASLHGELRVLLDKMEDVELLMGQLDSEEGALFKDLTDILAD